MSKEPTEKILAVHPGAELYGSDRMFIESVRAFHEAGIGITVVLPENGPLVARVEAIGATVAVLPFSALRKTLLRATALPGFLIAFALDVVRAAQLIRRANASSVYVSTVIAPQWVLAGRLTGRRTVVHVHEADSTLGRGARRLLLAPILLAHAVLVNSVATQNYLLEALPRLRGRTAVVWNCVRDPGSIPASWTSGWPAEPIQLTLVGRISPNKGQDVAIEALGYLRRSIPAATLTLVGDIYPGYEDYADRLHRQTHRLGLADAVTFVGFRPDPSAAYDSATVVLVPSRNEPFGNVAIESMLRLRPVVVSATGGLTDSVTDGVNGRVVPVGDAAAIAAAVTDLVAAPDRTRAMVESALTFAVERHASAEYNRGVVASVRPHLPTAPTPRPED